MAIMRKIVALGMAGAMSVGTVGIASARPGVHGHARVAHAGHYRHYADDVAVVMRQGPLLPAQRSD